MIPEIPDLEELPTSGYAEGPMFNDPIRVELECIREHAALFRDVKDDPTAYRLIERLAEIISSMRV